MKTLGPTDPPPPPAHRQRLVPWLMKHRYLVALQGAIAVYVGAMTYLSWVRFLWLQAPTFDLGVELQTAYTALGGVPVDTPNYILSYGTFPTNFFGIHFVLINYLQSILLRLGNPVVVLFLFQWMALGLAADVVYIIAREAHLSPRISFAIGGIFLLFPPSLMSGMYDVHHLAIFPLATLLFYFGLDRRRWSWAMAGLFLGFLSQEAFMLLIPAVVVQVAINQEGGYLALWRIFVGALRRGLRGPLFRTIVSVARWFWRKNPQGTPRLLWVALIVGALATFWLELHLMQTVGSLRQPLVTSGAGWGISLGAASTDFSYRFQYWFLMTGLLAFLPILGVRKGLLLTPGLVLTFFSTHLVFAQFAWQYSFISTAGLFIASIEGLVILQGRASPLHSETDSPGGKRWAVRTRRLYFRRVRQGPGRVLRHPLRLLLAFLCIAVVLFSPFMPFTQVYFNPRPVSEFSPPPNYASVLDVAALVPGSAPVLASDNLFSFVATNPNAYPILYSSVPATHAYTLIDFVPPGFSPDYLLLEQGDYVAAETLLSSFPQAYGLRAMASIPAEPQSSSFPGMNYILLYKHGYHGPVEDLAQHPAQEFEPSLFMTTTGGASLVPDPAAAGGSALFVAPQSLGRYVAIWGPSTCCRALNEPPGAYQLHLSMVADYGSPSTGDPVLTVWAYDLTEHFGRWNVTQSMLPNGIETDLIFSITLSQPSTFFTVSFTGVPFGFGFYFLGLEIVPVGT